MSEKMEETKTEEIPYIVIDDEGKTHEVAMSDLYISPSTGRLYLYPAGPDGEPVFVWAVADDLDCAYEA